MYINIAKLHSDATLPTRKNPTDAGMDLYAYINTWDGEYFQDIPPFSFEIIKTGATVEIPKGHVGLIFPKSRNDHLIGAGVIDESYQGEILVKVTNFKASVLRISNGDAIAQLVIVPVATPEIVEVGLSEIHKVKTFRGKTGGIVDQIATIKSNVEIFTDGTVDWYKNQSLGDEII